LKAKRSRLIVIDANIAHAAGSSQAPSSARSRGFLDSVLKICHRAVMTPAIRDEWRRHKSAYASTWLTQMTSRKKVIDVVAGSDHKLGTAIRTTGFGDRQVEEVEKDRHLVEAALAADQIVCSLEVRAPAHFKRVAKRYGQLRNVSWVNVEEEHLILEQWLAKGAPTRRAWQLRD
jgi:hypothetical protein